jgi:hypothetical protein
LDRVVPEDGRGAVVNADTGLVERIPYELCVLVSLRKAIRRREIWLEGGNVWRDPDHDLLPDFEENRDVHYQALSKPRDPAEFIADLKKRHVESAAVRVAADQGMELAAVRALGRGPDDGGVAAHADRPDRPAIMAPGSRPGSPRGSPRN